MKLYVAQKFDKFFNLSYSLNIPLLQNATPPSRKVCEHNQTLQEQNSSFSRYITQDRTSKGINLRLDGQIIKNMQGQ